MDLLRSPNQNVQQAAAGALRNLVFRSTTNKLETRRQNGIREAVTLLRRAGSSEIQKQLTGREPGSRELGGEELDCGCSPKRRSAAVPPGWVRAQWCRFNLRLISSKLCGTGLGQVSSAQVVTLGVVHTRKTPRCF